MTFNWQELEARVQAALAPLAARQEELGPIYAKVTEEYHAATQERITAERSHHYYLSRVTVTSPDAMKAKLADAWARLETARMEELRTEALWRSANADWTDNRMAISHLEHLTAKEFDFTRQSQDRNDLVALVEPCKRRGGQGNHVFSIGSYSGGGDPNAVLVHCVWCHARLVINEQQAAIVLLRWSLEQGMIPGWPVLLPIEKEAATE